MPVRRGFTVWLLATCANLAERLRDNPFGRPLHPESFEDGGQFVGDVYALMAHPYERVRGLALPADRCDLLLLHINVEYLLAGTDRAGVLLEVGLGRKHAQPIADAHAIELNYRVAAATADHLEVRLEAGQGPFSSRDYRIRPGVVPVAEGGTFLHLSSSCRYGLAAHLQGGARLVGERRA